MQYNKLGHSDLEVSNICLGSMTWGTQNTEAEGHLQLDYAIEQGVNFIDTAEMYPATPISAETQGDSEVIIGSWLKARKTRDKVILATKVSGEGVTWIQDGAEINADKIRTCVEGSLKRLQTDYIDLYQLHWPNRGSYHFRQNWRFDPTKQDKQKTLGDIYESLKTLDELIQQGKIRHIGLSNESCWGTAQFLRIADENNFTRLVSIQNEYSLLHRSYDLDLGELSHNENIGLIPFSPLACGLLTGKYQNGKIPAGSRLALNNNLNGRITDACSAAVDAYVSIAQKHGLEVTQMAIAFCNQRPFVDSSIIGSTSVEQLKLSLPAADLILSDEVLTDIGEVYRRYPMPF